MRKRRNLKQHKFNLDLDNSHHKALSDFLTNMSYQGQASGWIIDTLLKSIKDTSEVPAMVAPVTPQVPQPVTTENGQKPAQPRGYIPKVPFAPVPKPGSGKKPAVRKVDEEFD